MRKAQEILDLLVSYLGTSDSIDHIVSLRVYPWWRGQIPAVNVTFSDKDVEPESQILGGQITHWIKTLELRFEVFLTGDDGWSLFNDIDGEIERLLSADNSPIDQITTDGKPAFISLMPNGWAEPETLSDGDEAVIEIPIRWTIKFIEKAGGTA